ncbi:alpha/beta fold hydrolase [Halomonas sp. V046]|uniref:alpha/beta fold hydrolase n=1 Tax=Halomonas sp. V046 TaxID=3459611 RepID=UPI0040445D4B
MTSHPTPADILTPNAEALAAGRQAYRESGEGPTIVLLHGISSGAASWEPLARHLPGYHLLAWDAPGYTDSQPLASSRPLAADYAARLDDWLTAVGVQRCVMVGHSLGAMMASAFAARCPERLAGMILADPALGYRHANAGKRDEVYRSRWTLLAGQGHDAYAAARAPRLLRDDASDDAIARVRDGMRRLNVDGFAQASWMLANDSLEGYVGDGWGVPAAVLCGDQDAITPPQACRDLAARQGLTYHAIPRAGHASYIDAPDAFARALDALARPWLATLPRG